MMMLGSKFVAWLCGPALVPMLIACGVWLTGKYVIAAREARDAVMIQQGVKKCESEWEIAIAQQKQRVAEASERMLSAQLAATELLNTELKTNAADVARETIKIREEAEAARRDAALSRLAAKSSKAALDELASRCVSERVLDMARGGVREGGADSKGGPAAKGKGGKTP